MTTMLHAVLLLNALLARLSFGDDIDPNDWTDTTWPESPFMALLHILSDGSLYQCGGSIVATDEWEGKGVILTAAHCVYGADAVMVQVGCTQTDCSDQLATAYNDDFMVVHPDYNPDLASNDIHWQDNDIALIFLRESIDVAGAQRVQLHNDMSFLVNDDNVTVYGYLGTCEGSYGCTGGSDTDTLEFARTNFMAADECDNVWGRYVTGPHDFCVKDDTWRNGLQGVCRGDSGSPALVDGKQIGLNSWGPASCDARHPSVLTAVPYYFAWISEQCPQCVGLAGAGAAAPVSPDSPEDVASEAACSVQTSGFYTFWWMADWDMNGEYTLAGEHDGKPMYQSGEFLIAYSSMCSRYLLTDTDFLPYSASYCRCNRNADNVDQCATYGWECSAWVGPGTISGCAAHTASAHSAVRSRMWHPDANAQDDWHDVAANVTCGAGQSFALDYGEEHFLRFRLNTTSDVTLSNCETTFDTTLKLWSQDRSVELSHTLGGCDGDDCGCADCPDWHNEHFSIEALAAGTYFVQIGTYGGHGAGDYQLDIECAPHTAAIEPIEIAPEWIAPESAPELNHTQLMQPGLAAARSRLELLGPADAAPAQDDWDDVAADVACGAEESFPLALRAEYRYLRLRLDEAKDVTLSNCDTTFDTILRLWSQDRDEELSQTLGGCDGDDCECAGCDWHNEQFSISALPAGTYYVQIGAYGSLHGAHEGYYAGDYKLNIECSPPTAAGESIEPEWFESTEWLSTTAQPTAAQGLSAWIAFGDAQGVYVSRDLLAVALFVCVLILVMLVLWRRTPTYAKVQTLDDSEQATQSEAEEILHVAD